MGILDTAELVAPRPWMIGGYRRLDQIGAVMLHFTGSGLRDRYPDRLELEYDSSKSWLQSNNNHYDDWGSSWNLLLSESRLAIGVPLNNACHYGSGVHDPWVCNVELTMPDRGLVPWPEKLIDRAARLTAELCLLSDIPIQRIPYLDENNGQEGIGDHMHSANGRKWGKNDFPDNEFPWADFLARVKSCVQGGDDMALDDKLVGLDGQPLQIKVLVGADLHVETQEVTYRQYIFLDAMGLLPKDCRCQPLDVTPHSHKLEGTAE